MTIEQRVAKLERQNRWMKRGGGLALAAVACVVLMGQGKTGLKRLTGRQLFLKDEQGTQYAWMGGTDDGSAQLNLHWKEGVGIHLGTGPDRSSLLKLFGNDASARISVTDNTTLDLRAEDKKTKTKSRLAASSGASLTISRWGLGWQSIAILGMDREHAPYLKLSDRSGNWRVILRTDGDGSPSLTFYDEDGNVIWQAPPK